MSNRGALLFMGIEIGGTKLQVVAGDEQGNIVDRIRLAVQPGRGASGIQQQLEEAIQTMLGRHNIAAVGVGFGGPIDHLSGTIQVSHQVDGWANINLIEWLAGCTNLPVAADNDANTAALGEAIYGSGRGFNNVFYMTIGSGIGGGLVVNKKVYHGRVPGEVEIGHLRLHKNGDTVEQCCSGWAVNKKVEEWIAAHPDGLLAQLHRQQAVPGAYLLKPAIEMENADAKQILHTIADDLAFALSHVVHLFNPNLIIIGGGLSLIGSALTTAIQTILPGYIMKALLPAPPVLAAGLMEDAVPAGALQLAQQVYHQS